MDAGRKGVVCVTGAGGFLASWLIKLLLSQGYTVHGTLRNPDDKKHDHLRSLENAAEKLKFFQADLLDQVSMLAAIKGCEGVFHVASPVPPSPVPDPEVQLLKPALEGTLNVLRACSEAKVKRAVLVSTAGAVFLNPKWPEGQIMDESCWSDPEYCKSINNWYCYSKTLAEAEAWKYAKSNGLNIVTLLPTHVLGPMLQHNVNASSLWIAELFQGGAEEMQNNLWMLVDCRDVVEAIKLVYEKPEAEGRYICTAHSLLAEDLLPLLRETYPDSNYPKRFKEGKKMAGVSSEKLQKLGWKYRLLKETLVDSVQNYKQLGLIP